MGKEKGVYQLENGYWAYRFVIVLNGKTINRKKTKEENLLKWTRRSSEVFAVNGDQEKSPLLPL